MAKRAPITNEFFFENAVPLPIIATAVPMKEPHKSGSVGYIIGEKVMILVGGVPTPAYLSGHLTVIGSKPQAETEPANSNGFHRPGNF